MSKPCGLVSINDSLGGVFLLICWEFFTFHVSRKFEILNFNNTVSYLNSNIFLLKYDIIKTNESSITDNIIKNFV